MTKLCCLGQDNPPFSVFERHAELTECLQPKHKTTEELKVTLQTIWEEMPREHINKTVAIFTKCLTAYVARLPIVVTPSICNNSVQLEVCILISSPTNWLFSQTPTDYP